jgi:RNase P protein component
MRRATHPAAARLHRPSEFAAALKGRRVSRGALFVLSAALQPDDGAGQAQARLGMIIAKRHAPLAVTRSALKRVVREAFRAVRHELPAGNYVVRLQARVPDCSLTALKRAARAEVDTHFRKARQC